LIGLGKAAQLPYASSLCGACREVCPVKIDIPELLLHLRAEITENAEAPVPEKRHGLKRHKSERLAFRFWTALMMRPRVYELSARLARLMQLFIVRKKRIGRVSAVVAKFAPPLGAWTSGRDMRPLDATSFRELWRSELVDENDVVKQ
jgi:L-lactate dehydrogenase complex protein LldF